MPGASTSTTGSLKEASFHSITTTGDGSVGIQVSRPMGSLTVRHDVRTTGGAGTSLVEGVQVTLRAAAFSVKDGGEIDAVTVGGALRTEGPDVVTFEVEDGGTIKAMTLAGGIAATGAGSRATKVRGSIPSLDGVAVRES